jgi:hypothetical protein
MAWRPAIVFWRGGHAKALDLPIIGEADLETLADLAAAIVAAQVAQGP